MRQDLSMSDLALRISQSVTAKRDFAVDTKTMVFERDGVEVIDVEYGERQEEVPRYVVGLPGGAQFNVNGTCHGQMAQWTGIGKRYYERCRHHAPELLETNVRHWLTNNKRPERMLRTLDDTARALLSLSYRRIDNAPFAEAVFTEAAKHEGAMVRSSSISDSQMTIKMTKPGNERATKVGDLVQFGVAAGNSETGNSKAWTDIFAEVLACTNGMVFRNSLGSVSQIHLGRRFNLTGMVSQLVSAETLHLENQAFFSGVRDAVNAAFDGRLADRMITKIDDATEHRISGDVPGAVQELGKTYSLTQHERSDILRHLIEGNDLSQWGVVNAVTRAAEDRPSYDRATDLEAIGASMLDMTPTVWRRISEADPVRVQA